ncbi:MAG TPA: DUF2851 family protein [Chitinophagaceae bacterium]
MEEQLLQFIWHRKLFQSAELVTTAQEPIEILYPGTPNQDQGPDFLQSRVRIGDQLWAGHVEIHILSSAWFLHMHDQDTHYNNVILHVVWEEDQPAITQDGYRVPCLELAKRIDVALLDRYRHLMNNEEWVPCASALNTVSPLIKTSWLDRMMAERLEQKTDLVLRLLDRCANNWDQAFYALLSRQLGAPANSEAMEELGTRIPIRLLRKHKDRPDQVEAILFGAAGMLGKEINEPYCLHLYNEFDFLRKKYQLRPMPALQWKFMRMRPAHFPTLRIAQLAALIIETDQFVSLFEHPFEATDWIKLFSVSPSHEFWNDHFHFMSTTPGVIKRLGKSTAISLIINVVAPIMFVYGKHQGKPQLKDKAIALLEGLPAEKNGMISRWAETGWMVTDAAKTQGLLHLKKEYCDKRRCLHCAIGMQVIK